APEERNCHTDLHPLDSSTVYDGAEDGLDCIRPADEQSGMEIRNLRRASHTCRTRLGDVIPLKPYAYSSEERERRVDWLHVAHVQPDAIVEVGLGPPLDPGLPRDRVLDGPADARPCVGKLRGVETDERAAPPDVNGGVESRAPCMGEGAGDVTARRTERDDRLRECRSGGEQDDREREKQNRFHSETEKGGSARAGEIKDTSRGCPGRSSARASSRCGRSEPCSRRRCRRRRSRRAGALARPARCGGCSRRSGSRSCRGPQQPPPCSTALPPTGRRQRASIRSPRARSSERVPG